MFCPINRRDQNEDWPLELRSALLICNSYTWMWRSKTEKKPPFFSSFIFFLFRVVCFVLGLFAGRLVGWYFVCFLCLCFGWLGFCRCSLFVCLIVGVLGVVVVVVFFLGSSLEKKFFEWRSAGLDVQNIVKCFSWPNVSPRPLLSCSSDDVSVSIPCQTSKEPRPATDELRHLSSIPLNATHETQFKDSI